VVIPSDFEEWILREGVPAEAKTRVSRDEAKATLDRTQAELQQQLSILTDLRVRNYIPEEEFVARRKRLELECEATQRRLDDVGNPVPWFEPMTAMISFSKCAIPWLLAGDEETKRTIVRTVGSNPTLVDKKLNIGKAKPFVAISETEQIPNWGARLSEVRTLIEEKDPETMAVIQSIKMLEVSKGLVAPPLTLDRPRDPPAPAEADAETADRD
jgi:hypothetical protein